MFITLLAACAALATTVDAAGTGVMYYTPASKHTVTFNSRSLIIDGQPTLMLSGAVHYTRIHEDEWARVFSLAKEMGLNTIQTYVFWNAHETDVNQVGNATWEGRANLPRFIQLAADAGLWVNVRIGPYICGEYYFGGIPVWMRDSGAECFRCSDKIWEQQMARWVKVVVEKIRPQLTSNGGNVFMLQIENEYSGGGGAGGHDQEYLDWAVDMARDITTEVPWELCHDIFPCTAVNTNNSTGVAKYEYKAICTINGFWMDELVKENYQPSPKWLSDLQTGNPGQPWIWTEDQGWFDQWGVAKRVRDSRDQLYGIARFYARGGSVHDFYMLTGGNNYAKLSGGEVTTAYAPDTVIDYLLLRHQPRFDYYKRFFNAIATVSSEMLKSSIIPTPQRLTPTNPRGGNSTATANANLGHCTDDDPSHVGTLDNSQQWKMNPSSSSGAFTISNVGLSLCIDPLSSNTKTPSLKACSNTPEMQWTYSAKTKQFASVTTRPCQVPASKKKQCHVCLDQQTPTTLDLWDCKPTAGPAGGKMVNQEFTYDSKLLGILTEGTGAARQCLTATASGGGGAEATVYGGVAFLSNMDDGEDAAVHFHGNDYYLPNHTVAIVRPATGEVVFNSSMLDPALAATKMEHVQRLAVQTSEWTVYQEEVGSGAMTKTSTNNNTAEGPIEQLQLTGGQAGVAAGQYYTDYLWYTTTIPASSSGEYNVKTTGGYGTIFYVYVDGQLIPQQQHHTVEHASGNKALNTEVLVAQGSIVSAGAGAGADAGGAAATVKLQVLSVAMGLYNGGVGPSSVKGLATAKVNDADVTDNVWTHSWMMDGESKEIWNNPSAVQWSPTTRAGGTNNNNNSTLSWFKTTYDLPAPAPADVHAHSSPAAQAGSNQPAPQVSYALSLIGANKGVVFVNGFELGRYWLTPGSCSGTCAPPIKNGHCYMHWSGCDEPTQTLYHIPTPVLKPTGNLVVIFEETSSAAVRNLDKIQLVELKNH